MSNEGCSWRPISWMWASKDSDDRVGFEHMNGTAPLSAVVDHVWEISPNVALEDVEVTQCVLKHRRPATPEELDQRRKAEESTAERHRLWEERHVQELIDKYGTDLTQWPGQQ